MGEQGYGIDVNRLNDYARQIKEIHDLGVQISIVIGGGNIFRGLSGAGKGFDRVKGDQMGMCATVINSLALSSALGAVGCKSRVLTAIRMEPIGEFYTKWKAIEAMENGDTVDLAISGFASPLHNSDYNKHLSSRTAFLHTSGKCRLILAKSHKFCTSYSHYVENSEKFSQAMWKTVVFLWKQKRNAPSSGRSSRFPHRQTGLSNPPSSGS